MHLFVKKDRFKFSSAHMTVFPDGTKERLHGHNYQVELHVELLPVAFNETLSFAELKKPLGELCEAWDERVLLASRCPFLKLLGEKDGSLQFSLCDKYYALPKDEVVLLETDNITVENLTNTLLSLFVHKLTPHQKSKIANVTLEIGESAGQGAYETWRLQK